MRQVLGVLLLVAVLIHWPLIAVVLAVAALVYGVVWWMTWHPRISTPVQPVRRPEWQYWLPAAYRELNAIEIGAGLDPTEPEGF